MTTIAPRPFSFEAGVDTNGLLYLFSLHEKSASQTSSCMFVTISNSFWIWNLNCLKVKFKRFLFLKVIICRSFRFSIVSKISFYIVCSLNDAIQNNFFSHVSFENHLSSPKVLLFSGQRVSQTLGSSLRNDRRNKNRPHVNIKAKLTFKNKKSTNASFYISK